MTSIVQVVLGGGAIGGRGKESLTTTLSLVQAAFGFEVTEPHGRGVHFGRQMAWMVACGQTCMVIIEPVLGVVCRAKALRLHWERRLSCSSSQCFRGGLLG